MQIADAGARREIREQRLCVLRVAERRLAGDLEAPRERASMDVRPGLRIVAVHLDDFGLDVRRDQRALRSACRDR